jgi:diadenosine tetraphosphate (Ap4A) HIT family hydrolase
VGTVMRKALGADRVNYAILGNTEPHVHFHLVPRKRSGDPVPSRPPWEHPIKAKPLSPAQRDSIVRVLADALTGVLQR